MKIRFTKNVSCDYFDTSMDEVYPKYITRFTEMNVESVNDCITHVDINLHNGDVLLNVPKDAFQTVNSNTPQ